MIPGSPGWTMGLHSSLALYPQRLAQGQAQSQVLNKCVVVRKKGGTELNRYLLSAKHYFRDWRYGSKKR